MQTKSRRTNENFFDWPETIGLWLHNHWTNQTQNVNISMWDHDKPVCFVSARLMHCNPPNRRSVFSWRPSGRFAFLIRPCCLCHCCCIPCCRHLATFCRVSVVPFHSYPARTRICHRSGRSHQPSASVGRADSLHRLSLHRRTRAAAPWHPRRRLAVTMKTSQSVEPGTACLSSFARDHSCRLSPTDLVQPLIFASADGAAADTRRAGSRMGLEQHSSGTDARHRLYVCLRY